MKKKLNFYNVLKLLAQRETECDGKCAGWGCYKNDGVIYYGFGCVSDDICQGIEFAWAYTCDNSKTCAEDYRRKNVCYFFTYYLSRIIFLYINIFQPWTKVPHNYTDPPVCTPIIPVSNHYKAPESGTPNKDVSKAGIMAIAGMNLLGWIITQFY